MENLSDRMGVLMACGPASAEVLTKALEQPLADIDKDRSVALPGMRDARAHRYDWAPVPVYLLILSTEDLNKAKSRLLESGAIEGEWSTFHTLRIEKGTPWPEFEVNDSVIPYECGLDDVVSLTKGCFVGQEIVARMKNLGESPRHLRGLVFEDATVPSRASEVMVGDVHAGRILTSGYSDRLGVAIATTSLLKKTAEAGTKVQVGGQSADVRLFPL
jgi:folate-binding protein YgfZ